MSTNPPPPPTPGADAPPPPGPDFTAHNTPATPPRVDPTSEPPVAPDLTGERHSDPIKDRYEQMRRQRQQQPTPVVAPATTTAVQPSRVSRRTLLGGGIGLAGLAALGIGAGVAVNHHQKPAGAATPSASTTPTTGGTLSWPAPPGWAPTIGWQVPLPGMSTNTLGQLDGWLSVRGNVIVYASSSDRIVHVRDATTGAEQPSLQLTAASGGLIATTDPNQMILWTRDNTTLTLTGIPTNGGDTHRLWFGTIPAQANVTTYGGGILVTAVGGIWRVDPTHGLVAGPAGTTPLGVTVDGKIITTSSTGMWTITDPTGHRTTPHKITAPPGAVGDMSAAYLVGTRIAVWWPTSDPNTRIAGAATLDGHLIATGRIPTTDMLKQPLFLASDDSPFMCVGTLLINQKTGHTVQAPSWQGAIVNPRGLGGTVNGQKAFWIGTGQPTVIDPATVIPWGATGKGAAVVLVKDTAGNVTMLTLPTLTAAP